MERGGVTLFLCGDVMPGRGVDQILAHPGDPRLQEDYIRDARWYVRAAEAVNGRIHRPVDFAWPWGSAVETIDDFAPDVRVINLESSVTRSDAFAPEKPVHYRMNPRNVSCLTAVRPDVCGLANNHTLDFGRQGLTDTLDALSSAGLRWVGAGRDVHEACHHATVPVYDGRRVVVFAFGMASSGIPPQWAATPDRPGVNFTGDLCARTAREVADQVRSVKRPGDVAVASLHWGSNWGYGVSPAQVDFAHLLVDGGVDVVHGHSSHHPRPIEVYRRKLILYGCGDCIDDYEGISGYEEYRDDLRVLYFATIDPSTGTLARLRMVPMQARRMRLQPVCSGDAAWLRAVLTRISEHFHSRVDLEQDGTLVLRQREH